MNELNQEQMLNAYVDDELTASERIEVETVLASDPESRRTVDALRTVHEAVGSLPRRRLDRDLADDVIAEATRRQKADAPRPASTLDEPQTAPTWRQRVFQPRNLAYPLLAVGMAVAISLLFPSQEDQLRRQRAGDQANTTQQPPIDEVRPFEPSDPTGTDVTPIDTPPPRPAGGTVVGNTDPSVVVRASFTVQGSISYEALADREFETALGNADIEPISRVSGPGPDQVTFGIKTNASRLESLGIALASHDNIEVDWSPEDLQDFVRTGTEGETASTEFASIRFTFDITE